ncbi:unnamed protein product, partial [Ectocarpus sp. 4 AP-2014]
MGRIELTTRPDGEIYWTVFGIWWYDAVHPQEMLDAFVSGVCVLGPLHWAGLEVTHVGIGTICIVRCTYMRHLVHDTGTLGSFVALNRMHGCLQSGPAVENRLVWVTTRCFQIVTTAGCMLYVFAAWCVQGSLMRYFSQQSSRFCDKLWVHPYHCMSLRGVKCNKENRQCGPLLHGSSTTQSCFGRLDRITGLCVYYSVCFTHTRRLYEVEEVCFLF